LPSEAATVRAREEGGDGPGGAHLHGAGESEIYVTSRI
jgi:hypothetical protein